MDEPRKKLLVVEDNEHHYTLINMMLADIEQVTLQVDWAANYDDALTNLHDNTYDVCLLDYKLGHVSGLGLLRTIREAGNETPVVLLTSMGDEAVAVEAMKSGATDYIRKENLSPDVLWAAIRYAQDLHHEEQRRRKAEADLQKALAELEMRVEERTAELSQANERLQIEVAERKAAEEAERAQRTLAESLQRTAEALGRSAQVEDALRLTIEHLGKVVKFDRAAVMLADEQQLRMAAYHDRANGDGLHPPFDTAELNALDASLSSGKPLAVGDTRETPGVVPLPDISPRTRSWIGVPLVAWDVIIGFMTVASDQPHAFSQRDTTAVMAIGQQAAFVIENRRILTQLGDSLAELEQAQERLNRSAQLSAAGEMATGVAHQINNPLTTILAECFLLLKKLPPDDPTYESIAAMRNAAERAGLVVRRLLDLSRTTPYIVSPIGVNDTVETAVSLVRAQLEPQIRVVANLSPDMPPVAAAPEHLEEVWINLLVNAKDAIGKAEGGVIEVTSEPDADGQGVVVRVRDNGVGVRPSQLDSLFDPFFTTKEYGTGLGLSICRDVITRHGGSITVESNGGPGEGAAFTVWLPVADN